MKLTPEQIEAIAPQLRLSEYIAHLQSLLSEYGNVKVTYADYSSEPYYFHKYYSVYRVGYVDTLEDDTTELHYIITSKGN